MSHVYTAIHTTRFINIEYTIFLGWWRPQCYFEDPESVSSSCVRVFNTRTYRLFLWSYQRLSEAIFRGGFSLGLNYYAYYRQQLIDPMFQPTFQSFGYKLTVWTNQRLNFSANFSPCYLDVHNTNHKVRTGIIGSNFKVDMVCNPRPDVQSKHGCINKKQLSTVEIV